VLDAGPAAWGWDEDQCWTLARIAELVRRRSGVDYTLAGLDLLLHRMGWSVQVPGPPGRGAGRGGSPGQRQPIAALMPHARRLEGALGGTPTPSLLNP
jgi:hypothetical protein